MDRKVPRWLRPYLLLLTDADHILWLPGRQIADSANVTPVTRQILEITLHPATSTTSRIFHLFNAVLSFHAKV